MQLFVTLFKAFFFWIFIGALPGAIAYIFGGNIAVIATCAAIGLFLLIDAFGSERKIIKSIRPSRMEIANLPILVIEDASSHCFITKQFFSSKPTIWITRGALSLLTPEEITALVQGMRVAGEKSSLRFETVLSTWMMRITANIPDDLREVLFFREKGSKTIHMRESIRGVVWVSLILLLEVFYSKTRKYRLEIPEEVLRKLEAESRRCVPRLPVALSNHSAVSPWPDAFLTLGRPCLLPWTAVNLET